MYPQLVCETHNPKIEVGMGMLVTIGDDFLLLFGAQTAEVTSRVYWITVVKVLLTHSTAFWHDCPLLTLYCG